MLRAHRDSFRAALNGGAEHWDALTTRWMGALVLVLCAGLASVLLTIVPPTASGPWGWEVAGVIIAFRVAAAAWLVAGTGPVPKRRSYAIALAGIAGLCTLQFLASDEAFFHDLLLIDLLYVAAVHTPRCTAFAVALAIGGMVPSLLRGGPETVTVAEWGAEAILWSLVAGLVAVYVARVRAQRADLRRAGRQAEALARVDVLTGLGNRRFFDEILEREIDLARRYETPVSVVVGDLDGFKGVNDRHGHAAGDEVLRRVAACLDDAVRRPDACFRWGGDEFAVVLPHTSAVQAELVAARIRGAVAREVHDPGDTPVGLTLGLAELEPGQDADALLAEADRALLAAKPKRATPRRPAWRFVRAAAPGAWRR
ncbi:MAG TPA: diguanylate cyclase [Solirubrobacteraceae bacterium]|nr:diguanylate cyclase [Solirubrobacteraceae bacterium]